LQQRIFPAFFMGLGQLDEHPALDLVVRDGTGQLSLLLNDGTGRFKRVPTEVQVNLNTFKSMGIGDLDADGRDDILIGFYNWPPLIDLYVNREGGFEPSGTIALDEYQWPDEIRVADFDGDRSPEIVVLSSGQRWGQLLLLNPKDGRRRSYNGYEIIDALVIDDFDQDGGLDVAYASDSDGWHSFLRVITDPMSETSGMWEFKIPGTFSHGTSAMTGDADGDGTADIVVGFYDWKAAIPGAAIIYGSRRTTRVAAEPMATAPRPLALDLQPNPTQGDATVRLAARAPGPARLEVFDLAGRRVHGETHLIASAGVHPILLSLPRELPGGLYLVRVTIGGQAAVARLALLR